MDYIGEESTVLSSSNLFHYTPKLEYLLGIIECGFKPRFCKEMYSFFDGSGEEGEEELSVQGVPMVCFCDIPIELSANHKNTYGGYAIVMTKIWAVKNGIQPVMYVTDEFARDSIKMLVNNSWKYDDSNLFLIQRILHFYKQYSGPYERKSIGFVENYKFYDEREWRYIPNYLSGRSVLSKFEMEDGAYVNHHNACQIPLEFENNDVVGIFVKNEEESKQVVNALCKRGLTDAKMMVHLWS